jgi:hypothetical protein
MEHDGHRSSFQRDDGSHRRQQEVNHGHVGKFLSSPTLCVYVELFSNLEIVLKVLAAAGLQDLGASQRSKASLERRFHQLPTQPNTKHIRLLVLIGSTVHAGSLGVKSRSGGLLLSDKNGRYALRRSIK